MNYFFDKLELTAMAIAIEDSVTVSIGDEISGVFNVIFLVRAEVKSYRHKAPKIIQPLTRSFNESLAIVFCGSF